MNIPVRYQMNMGVLNKQEFHKLQQVKVIIIGLGGIGGHFANQLLRLGVQKMVLVDFDRFTETNLNRQLFSKVENMGEFKVDVISNELKKIDPKASIEIIRSRVQDIDHLEGDYLIDCVDNKETKIYLSTLSNQLNIPLLHGSCAGWYGQVGWMSPSCTLIEDLYEHDDNGLEEKIFNPPFLPNVIASYMVGEFTKMIKQSSNIVLDELLFIDLFNLGMIRSGGKHHG